MKAPKKLYWLELETIGKLKYREKGGGKFTSLAAAQARQDGLLKYNGIKSTIYETGELDWRPVEDGE
jgi:hypothetical protein